MLPRLCWRRWRTAGKGRKKELSRQPGAGTDHSGQRNRKSFSMCPNVPGPLWMPVRQRNPRYHKSELPTAVFSLVPFICASYVILAQQLTLTSDEGHPERRTAPISSSNATIHIWDARASLWWLQLVLRGSDYFQNILLVLRMCLSRCE